MSAVALTIIPYVLLKPFNHNAAFLGGATYFIGELSFAMWLDLKGVDLAKWQEKAGGSTASL